MDEFVNSGTLLGRRLTIDMPVVGMVEPPPFSLLLGGCDPVSRSDTLPPLLSGGHAVVTMTVVT